MEGVLVQNSLYFITIITVICIFSCIFKYFSNFKTWNLYDWLILVCPGPLYSILYFFRFEKLFGESLGNIFDPVIISFCVILLWVAKSVILIKSDITRNKIFSIITLIVALLLTFSLYYLMPSLPE